MSWSRRFEDPIPRADGRDLVKLRDAGEYIAALPAKTARLPHWTLATEMLLAAADGKLPLMMARIAMMRALNHGRPKPEIQRRARVMKIIAGK